MEKIIIWYLDDDGNTRIQMLDKPSGYLIQTFLYEFSQKPAVQTIMEAYTVSAIHEVHENTWTEGFWVSTTNLDEDEASGDQNQSWEEKNRGQNNSWESRGETKE